MAADVMAAAVPVVLTAAGAPVPVTARRNWSGAARRPDAARAFCSLIFGATPSLTKVQVICAAGSKLAAGMVNNNPVSEPKLAGFPVTAALASVQLALAIVK